MNEHQVLEWIEAYYDGELSDARARQVNAHLAECEICREALAKLEELSTLLQAAPEAEKMPLDQFVDQVRLRLPRRPYRSTRERAFVFGWQLVPVGLLLTWIAFQAAIAVAWGTSALQYAGLELRGFFSMLGISEGAPGPLSLLTSWWLGAEPTLIDLVGSIWSARWLVFVSVGVTLGIGIVLLSWVAGMWAYRRHRQLVAEQMRA